jgi:hypothetical protein
MGAALKYDDRRNYRQDEAKGAFRELRVCEHAQNEHSFVSPLLCVLCDSRNKKVSRIWKRDIRVPTMLRDISTGSLFYHTYFLPYIR